MDLESIVKYRDRCIICQNKLKFYIKDYKDLQFDISKYGFRIKSGAHENGVKMLFGFDGSYQKGKRHFKIYDKKLTIFKYCNHCQKKAPKLLAADPQPVVKIKPFSSMTAVYNYYYQNTIYDSLNNLKNLECNYCFQIAGYDDKYNIGIDFDSVRYYDEEYFYYVHSSFVGNGAVLTHGRFDSSIDDILSLKINAPVNLSKVADKDQFIDKCKRLILFS